MRILVSISCFLWFIARLMAAEPVGMDVVLKDKSWFTDRSATAVAVFDEVVKPPETVSRDSDDCHFLEIEVSETPDSKLGKSVAVIHFLPKRTGLITLPSLEFSAGETIFHTRPVQLLVGAPHRSDAMSLAAKPAKLRVYVGEPLRVNLSWKCSLSASTLRELRWFPTCFSDSNVDVVVPRNTGAEEAQVGLPLGGRRVIATRSGQTGDALGTISVPIFLRYATAGKHEFPEMRLDCGVLAKERNDFARYAVYFNNGLFDPVENGELYERTYVTAPAFEIEVLPLPDEGKSADFSGLFDPVTADVSLRPADVEVGQLMELEIKLSGEAPHGMLELPPLSHQSGLRGRFLVDDVYGRLWHEKGTIFSSRLRALSTSVKALPSLRFQVFDPLAGHYRWLKTDAIPLVVKPGKGHDFIALGSYDGAVSKLTDQPLGIWQNPRINFMNDLINQLFFFAQRGFVLFLLVGPVVFLALLPWMRERRRRALHPRYRARVLAFKTLEKMPTAAPDKWPAFLRFMAATFGAMEQTWTVGDSQRALRSIGATDEDLQEITALHETADAEDFSGMKPKVRFVEIDPLARRIMRLLAKSALLWIAVTLFTSLSARADEWSGAQTAFKTALNAPPGSDGEQAAYQKAALKFQAAAAEGTHIGEAWNNAGNAWFQAGELGRSIAAYRRAQDYRPFDAKLAGDLTAARALVGTAVPAKQAWWKMIPEPWLKLVIVNLNFVFWILLLPALRYRNRRWIAAASCCGFFLLIAFGLLLTRVLTDNPAGVIIVNATNARKGPGYSYANAFNEPLRDGLEFSLIEQRGTWARIKLADSRECWVPKSQTESWPLNSRKN